MMWTEQAAASGYPEAFYMTCAADPREMRNVVMENAWVTGPYMQAIGEYRATLKDHPNPPPPNVVNF